MVSSGVYGVVRFPRTATELKELDKHGSVQTYFSAYLPWSINLPLLTNPDQEQDAPRIEWMMPALHNTQRQLNLTYCVEKLSPYSGRL